MAVRQVGTEWTKGNYLKSILLFFVHLIILIIISGCAVLWEEEDGIAAPARVTVILSGGSIWKDPNAIEATVSALLGCECVTAIE